MFRLIPTELDIFDSLNSYSCTAKLYRYVLYRRHQQRVVALSNNVVPGEIILLTPYNYLVHIVCLRYWFTVTVFMIPSWRACVYVWEGGRVCTSDRDPDILTLVWRNGFWLSNFSINQNTSGGEVDPRAFTGVPNLWFILSELPRLVNVVFRMSYLSKN